MLIKRIVAVGLIITIVSLLVVVVIGILYKPKLKPINFSTTKGEFLESCIKSQVKCDADSDCQHCLEAGAGISMKCADISRTPEQAKVYGPSKKICVPASAEMKCNTKQGGMVVLSGENALEWDCLCTYPNYAAEFDPVTGDCNINAGVCDKGTFTMDVTDGKTDISCVCPSGYTLVHTTDGQIPRCVPSSMYKWYSDLEN